METSTVPATDSTKQAKASIGDEEARRILIEMGRGCVRRGRGEAGVTVTEVALPGGVEASHLQRWVRERRRHAIQAS